MFVAYEGIRWEILPAVFPPKSTVHRWFQVWEENGIFNEALDVVAAYGEMHGYVDLRKSFIDGMFVRSKNGSEKVGKTKCGKGHKVMVLVDANGAPIGIHVNSASPHEVTLAETTIDSANTSEFPDKVIGDKAYDSDALDQRLTEDGIEMIAPHKNNRINKTQDGRKLRSYKQRWKVEAFNNKIQRFRKIVIKYELHFNNFVAFVKIATLMVAARHYGLI